MLLRVRLLCVIELWNTKSKGAGRIFATTARIRDDLRGCKIWHMHGHTMLMTALYQKGQEMHLLVCDESQSFLHILMPLQIHSVKFGKVGRDAEFEMPAPATRK